jgi:hypothetical protein
MKPVSIAYDLTEDDRDSIRALRQQILDACYGKHGAVCIQAPILTESESRRRFLLGIDY